MTNNYALEIFAHHLDLLKSESDQIAARLDDAPLGEQIQFFRDRVGYLASRIRVLERYVEEEKAGLERSRSRAGVRKLTIDQVRAIRRAAGFIPQAKLAAEYGVTPLTIHQVIARKTWRDVK